MRRRCWSRGRHGGCRVFIGIRYTVPTQHVLLNEVVPPAATANLHNVDRELTQRHCQRGQLRLRTRLSGRRLEFVAVDVVDMGEILPPADRAPILGLVAVETCCALQVRRGIAHLVRTNPVGVHLTQQSPPLERVVDRLPLRSHGQEGTRSISVRRLRSPSVIEVSRPVDCARVSRRSTVAMYRGDTSAHQRQLNSRVCADEHEKRRRTREARGGVPHAGACHSRPPARIPDARV